MFLSIMKQVESINQSRKTTCPSESSIKPCKRQSKNSRVKNCFHVEDFEQMPDTPHRRRIKSSEQHKTSNKTVTATKVKSASWKRSEKSTAPFNNSTNKKHKKSSNWLRFSNSKIKKSDTEQPYNSSESLSACRPGTTYSDVLFGAGCSNLVKIKNCITPRFYSNQSTNVAQKKLGKSLFKFNGKPDDKISEDSEAEEKKTLFPALQSIKNKFFPVSVKIATKNNNNNAKKTRVPSSTYSTSSPSKTDEAEVLMLPNMEGLTLDRNKVEHHVDDDVEAPANGFVNDSKYLFNSITKIPKWNFVCVETGTSDGFPKFLYQFEDENYLKAEKMALLGLKLAVGDYNPNSK